MDKINITLMQKPSVDPVRFIATSTRLNFKENDNFFNNMNFSEHDTKDLNIIKNLIRARHSPLEHCSYSILVSGASRAFLAQITRSRTFSYSSQSQHYTSFKQANFVVPIEIYEACERLNSVDPLKDFYNTCNQSHQVYLDMQKYGLKHDCTRSVTPQAMRNSLLITGNIRAWLHLIGLRICLRNTAEIRYIAYKIRELLAQTCPDIFNQSGPNCFCFGNCSEGKLTCGKPWKAFEDPEQARWSSLPELANKWQNIYSQSI